MTSSTPDDAEYDPTIDDVLHDSTGNPIDAAYIDRLDREAEVGYDLEELAHGRGGRPSLSDVGESPQVRFRLPADVRAEATALATREGKTLSQLARDALAAYLQARRSA